MAVLVVSTFEVSGLSAPALAMMKAAVLHAKKNQRVQKHTMSIGEMCHLAGLPSIPAKRFWSVLTEACGALGIVEAVDTSAPDRGDLPYLSWPVFDGVSVDGCDVTFAVCNRSFDEALMASLPKLQPSIRRRN
jgi:hypothetical protein